MKRNRIWQWLMALGFVFTSTVLSRADNFCTDDPYYTSDWTCSSAGSVYFSGTLNYTNISIYVGNSVGLPTFSSNPVILSGQKSATFHHTCPVYDETVYQSVDYSTYSSFYFVKTNSSWPDFPGPFTNTGTYYYTVKYDAIPAGGVCANITGIVVGTIQITVTNFVSPGVMLAYFPFDNTNTWVGSAGQLPLAATNVAGVPSWSTNAVLIDITNPAILTYRNTETNGNTNINLCSGSIQFWFKADWSSTNNGGVGPQNEGRLIEVGTKGTTNGWWGLVVGSAGTNIYFGTQTNSTSTLTTNLTTSINWLSNQWHQVVLTYSTNSSAIYIDGQPAMTNGLGITYYPGASTRTNGFSIGSSITGTNQAHGTFDELETFNYQLDAGTILTNYQSAMSLDSDGDGIPNIIENQWGWDPYSYNSRHGLNTTNVLQVFTPLK